MKSRKVLYRIVTFILGSLLLVTSVNSLYKHLWAVDTNAGLSETAARVMDGFWDTAYLMWLVKVIELSFAISLLVNWYVRFTTLLFCPVLVNIILFDIFADNRQGLTTAIFMVCATSYLIYCNRASYKSLLQKD